jgi:hypothetical protein
MKSRKLPKVYLPGPWKRLWERWRGDEVRVFESAEPLPVLVVRFPRTRQGAEAAETLRTAWMQLLTVMQPSPVEVYADVLQQLPRMVVVRFQERNPGGVLGHACPVGLESEETRQLALQTGFPVGEIDLAWKFIQQWQPRPLAALAVGARTTEKGDLQFRVALLTVLFHELEHLAFPERSEQEVRRRSDAFYESALEAGVRDLGGQYGLSNPG